MHHFWSGSGQEEAAPAVEARQRTNQLPSASVAEPGTHASTGRLQSWSRPVLDRNCNRITQGDGSHQYHHRTITVLTQTV